MRITAAATLLLFTCSSFSVLGCYDTYTVKKEEFEKLQAAPDGKRTVVIKDEKGENVEVGEGTNIFVRSEGGRRYPVTPFNFKISQTQLVASDRDTLLAVNGIASYEVDHISTWKTVGIVSLGAAAAAGVIVAIIVTAGSKTFE